MGPAGVRRLPCLGPFSASLRRAALLCSVRFGAGKLEGEDFLDAGQPWTIAAPKPPKAPKKGAKFPNGPTENEDGDAQRQRADEPAGEPSEPVGPVA